MTLQYGKLTFSLQASSVEAIGGQNIPHALIRVLVPEDHAEVARVQSEFQK